MHLCKLLRSILQFPHAAVFLVLTGDCATSPVVTVCAGFGLGVAGMRANSSAQASLNLSISFASVNGFTKCLFMYPFCNNVMFMDNGN